MKINGKTKYSSMFSSQFQLAALVGMLTLWLCMGLSACSSGPQVQEFPETANVVQELNTLDGEVNSALNKQVNVLSPEYFDNAKKSLESAKKSLEQKKDSKNTLNLIAQGNAYLKHANEVAALSHTHMEGVVVARQQALAAGASGFFSSDFHDADEKLRDVTSDLEDNELKSVAKNSASLQVIYLDLELRAIKQANLGAAQKKISQAVRDGAKEFAGQTLAIAEKNYKDTDAFITANRHDSEQIKTRVDAVNQSADHLLKIAASSKGAQKVSSEELALQMESKQNQVNAKHTELLAEKGMTQSLKSEQKVLLTEKDFNDQFEQARREFSPSEAEVYRQANVLTIRLRGLEFPTAQAVLKQSNFALLAKVQHIIKEFGTQSVVVEGHTDSEGGKEANEKLSEKRALAVREYLVANDAIVKENIKAIGYGYQKPLATNKTVAGRAQNRRVDVLIQLDKNQNL